MIDISNAKWNFSNEENYAIEWLNKNGFYGKIIKQYVSKTIFEISKNEVTYRFELPQDLKNVGRYMEQFSRNWEILCELQQLRKVKEEKNMTRENVLENLKELIGSEWDAEEVVCAFEDFEEDGETEVIAKESENNGYDYIAYINSAESTQFLFSVDEENVITDVWMA